MASDELDPAANVRSQGATSILLIDNHPLFRATVEQFLQQAGVGTLHVVGLAATSDVLPVAIAVRPDIVLVDVGTLAESDLNFIRSIRNVLPQVAIVALGWEDTAADQHAARTAGADALLLKDHLNRTLLATVAAVTSAATPRRQRANQEPDETETRTRDGAARSDTA